MPTLNVPIQLRRGSQSACPSVMLPGELYVCLDTGLLFGGTGTGVIQLGGGNAPVSEVFGRTGNITSEENDYAAFYDALGAALTAQSNAESFATSAVATETSRAEAAEALLAPKASPTFTGTVVGISAAMVGADASGAAATAQSNAETFATSVVATETSRAETAEALLVPKTTTVNGHALSGNVVVSASDLTTGSLPNAQLPIDTPPTGGGFWSWSYEGPQVTSTSNRQTAILGSAGAGGTICWLMYVPENITISHVSYEISTGVAGQFIDLGLYTYSGTLVANIGKTSAASGGSNVPVTSALTQGTVTLAKGWYYFAFTSTSTSVGMFVWVIATVNDSLSILNNRGINIGYNTTNQNGTLPSTMPSLTAQGNGPAGPVMAYFCN